MAGHVLRLQRERATHTTMYWLPEEELGEGQRRHGEVLSKKTRKRWVLAGMEPAGSPLTVRDGDFSSSDAPRGTGGPTSK